MLLPGTNLTEIHVKVAVDTWW